MSNLLAATEHREHGRGLRDHSGGCRAARRRLRSPAVLRRTRARVRFLRLRILTDLLGKPRWLLGIGCMVAGYLLTAGSIGHLELTLVEPLLTPYLVWALVLAVPMSRQAVKLSEVAGALILVGGVTLLSVNRSTRAEPLPRRAQRGAARPSGRQPEPRSVRKINNLF